ncbi:hypothetical protein [Desulfofundulus thermosubterraneus]|uniref:DUF8196 domain-containing protein n=1 Tax=Desulfofundulus thermosubterraneus DSM 16057 TaxID=1121432 RepID=A0A1M6FYQ0_9FIRM|nr:hypothetical protein [Desulfofundulus thermosubterraneus]SHJ02800.1 hypothetical protein SAMN02745219_01599 [Desulfofundulus thermosubterraneus DSM 16057]
MNETHERRDIKQRFYTYFDRNQASVLADMYEILRLQLSDVVRARDFNELKEIVRELGEAQKRTEARVDKLAEKVEELAEAQKRTEAKVEELAEAQKKTEQSVKALAEEMRGLCRITANLRTEQNGLAKSMAYALENEAYQKLPAYLKQLGIAVTEKFVRKYIGEEEINFFGRGTQNGENIIIVGETELKFTSAGKKLGQLKRKVAAVAREYPGTKIIKLLVTHFAKPQAIEKARAEGVIVIQSFEWL